MRLKINKYKLVCLNWGYIQSKYSYINRGYVRVSILNELLKNYYYPYYDTYYFYHREISNFLFHLKCYANFLLSLYNNAL